MAEPIWRREEGRAGTLRRVARAARRGSPRCCSPSSRLGVALGEEEEAVSGERRRGHEAAAVLLPRRGGEGLRAGLPAARRPHG